MRALPKILVVDDERPIINVIARELKGLFEVVGCATLREAEDALQDNIFAAVILDINLRPADGRKLLPVIQKTQGPIPVMIMTGRPDLEWVNDLALSSAARGLPGLTPWSKTADLDPVRAFALAALKLPAMTIREAVRRLARKGLTARHEEVLELKARGQTDEEIAHALGITVDTVKTHLRDIRSLLGMTIVQALAAVIAELAVDADLPENR